MSKNVVLGLIVVLALGAGGGVAWTFRDRLVGGVHTGERPDDEEDEGHRAVTLKAVKPHRNKAELLHEVTQPAYVQAYHTAALQARVAGTVKAVHKNIGDAVKAGEPLVEIDAPDLEQDVAQKEAMVTLAEGEVKAARASLVAVQASAKEAAALVGEKSAEIDRARSKRKAQQAALVRVRKLAESSAVQEDLVDERVAAVEAAEADVKAATAAVETAKANAEEFGAKVQQAKIDMEVKQAKVKVARSDHDRAKTLAGYAVVRAPFDGRVAQRHIDPGAFVQNASTGKSEALMTVVRSDKVTLVMWVPEREAPLVTAGQEAFVHLDALRGKEVVTRVSRVSGWLNPERARDMRVEADVDNAALGLRVGMYGSMRIVLQRFDRAWVLPAGAVFARGGQTLICEVVEGKARMRRVRVLYEDGVRAIVAKLEKRPDPKTGLEVDHEAELTGDEVIVRSGQGELRDRQEVEVTMAEW